MTASSTRDGDNGSRTPLWLAVAGAGFIGMLTAIQARINGQLGARLEDGFVAALVSFGCGLVLLIALSAVLPAGRQGVRNLVAGLRERRIPVWMLMGGIAGALTVATQGLTVAIIGVSLFTVGVVAGQTVSGLLLDRVGFGPAGVVAVTIPRLVGGALALAAVVFAVVQGGVTQAVPAWMLVLPFIVGMGLAWQQGTNGRLRAHVGTPLTATLVNFVGGTLLLAITAAIDVAVVGMPAALPAEPWLYLGGPLGVVYIFLAAALVARTGVLLLGIGTVAGQLVAALVLDLIWPARGTPDPLTGGIMLLLALASVVVVTVRWRRRSTASR